MGKQENYWRRFEQTGGVLDYLNYTACARAVTNTHLPLPPTPYQ